MSYHEITSRTQYRAKCQDCNFSVLSFSAGAVEQAAHDHIEYASEDGEQSNNSHTVETSAVTVIGRL